MVFLTVAHSLSVRETLRPNLSSFSSQPLGEALLRIALSEVSHAGKALQHALLAFSAQYRYGPVFRAEELKISALRALSLSATEGMSAHKAVQHVAAGMVLCMFEVSYSTLIPRTLIQALSRSHTVLCSIWDSGSFSLTILADPKELALNESLALLSTFFTNTH